MRAKHRTRRRAFALCVTLGLLAGVAWADGGPDATGASAGADLADAERRYEFWARSGNGPREQAAHVRAVLDVGRTLDLAR